MVKVNLQATKKPYRKIEHRAHKNLYDLNAYMVKVNLQATKKPYRKIEHRAHKIYMI